MRGELARVHFNQSQTLSDTGTLGFGLVSRFCGTKPPFTLHAFRSENLVCDVWRVVFSKFGHKSFNSSRHVRSFLRVFGIQTHYAKNLSKFEWDRASIYERGVR